MHTSLKHLALALTLALTACRYSGEPPVKPDVPPDTKAQACPEIYQPVCGKVQVHCIKAPCPPLYETFDNDCFADKAAAFDVTPGECPNPGPVYEAKPVSYRADGTEGYFAKPPGPGPHPAVILIHEWWGLNNNIRWYTEQFAEQGYAALAVDLYNGESTDTPDKARELAGAVRENMDAAFANLQDAVTFLQARDDVSSDQLASVGWCFGGGWSYEMAKNNLGVQASVIYYGRFNPADDLEQMRTTIMGHFGEDDQSIPVDDVKAFRAKLQTLAGEHQIFIYENQGHGFARELQSDSAKEAWLRTLQFLEEQL